MTKKIEKPTSVRFKEDELEILEIASKLSFNEKKHRKNYSVSSFVKESALNRAKRIIARANR